MFDKILEYIHINPVTAGFVYKPEDWRYSSARDFCNLKGLIELSYGQYSGTSGRLRQQRGTTGNVQVNFTIEQKIDNTKISTTHFVKLGQ